MRVYWAANCNYNGAGNYHINVRRNYRNIAQKFCSAYYYTYDHNPRALYNYYTPTSIFMYIDEELTGFNAVYNKMMHYDMYKFTHHYINVGGMPVGNNSILITVNGTMSINDSNVHYGFTETILLKRVYGSKFFVLNTILKLDRPVPFVDSIDMDDDMDIDIF